MKPLDFGGGSITGSVNEYGRIIALNTYHPKHGYITLTSADPFPESERYNPAAVRAYRAHLAELDGFGYFYDEPVVDRNISVLESAVPRIHLTFADGSTVEITTFATEEVVVQIIDMRGVKPRWQGKLCLQRCAYTQLTEGGPLPMPPLKMHTTFRDTTLVIENPILKQVVTLAGLVPGAAAQEHYSDQPVEIDIDQPRHRRTVLMYSFGETVEAAKQKSSSYLTHQNENVLLEETLADWKKRLQKVPDDRLIKRGVAYSHMCAVSIGDGSCLLTDHMLLPLSWNRDAYFMARALVSAGQKDMVRHHLVWMFEIAWRPNTTWARCYLANGHIKDEAFQLDQQLFPLLELAEYTLETEDYETFNRLQPYIAPVLQSLKQRKASNALLFPTDETPADDPIALPYHLSSHILFWYTLTKLQQLDVECEPDALRETIQRYFITEHDGKQLYAYATDGAGHFHLYHDANDLPLALAPAWGFVSADDPVWRNTIEFAFSEANEGGVYDGRLGSVHTRAPWTLGDVQEIIIARAIGDATREKAARERLRQAAHEDGALPEAYDSETGAVLSRHWFAWPNAALACIDLGGFD